MNVINYNINIGLSSELCALCFLGRAIVKLAHTENSPLIIHVGNEIRMIRKHNKYNKWESVWLYTNIIIIIIYIYIFIIFQITL